MTRTFLVAGVAALAIAAPASGKPGGGHGGDRPQAAVNHGGGGGGQRMQAMQRRGGGQHMQAMQRGGGGGRHAQAMGGGFAAPRMQHQQRFAAMQQHQPHMQRQAHQQVHMQAQNRQHVRAERMQAQNRQQMRANHAQQNRMAQRQQTHANRMQAQNRMAERQQMHANHMQAQNRMAERQQLRANRNLQIQNRMAQRQQLQLNRQNMMAQRQQLRNERVANLGHNAVGYGVGGCPPGLMSKACTPPGLAMNANRAANADVFRASRLATMAFAPRTRLIGPAQAYGFVGQPLSMVNNVVPLVALPQSVSYLYPNTPDYYYQYGGGYLYQVDRTSSLISALMPLLAGGFLPGQYLPSAYMNSYVPNYYGLNSFYPSSYDYGYGGYNPYGGYGGNMCNRYYNGVIYQVDCATGLVDNVVPLYASGYGVGQLLPSAYNYYNVPDQYRSMYYDTPDYGYWYAPGAIYQYDRGTSLITSVAALMSPGFSIGQPLPAGYGMYNVPLAYRTTYYDTPDAWYRYNNGYIYQVDPTTQLVTAIVASLLT